MEVNIIDKKKIKETRIYYSYNKVGYITRNYPHKKEPEKFQELSPLKRGPHKPRL